MLKNHILAILHERGLVEEFDSIYQTSQQSLKRLKARNRFSVHRSRKKKRMPGIPRTV